jgi:hypothetical protein
MPTARFHMLEVLEVKDVCATTSNAMSMAQNITGEVFDCVDLFCEPDSLDLLHVIIPDTNEPYPLYTMYKDTPNYVRKPVQTVFNAAPWIPILFDMINYCYYCNHPARKEFYGLITEYQCPYFWHHSKTYGRDGKNTKENPTLLSTMHESYINRKRSKLGDRNPTQSMSDFLFLTSLRTQDKDEIGEETRGDFPYFVFCSSQNMFSVFCDPYQWFVTPCYAAWLIIDIIIRVSLLATIYIVLIIPRVSYYYKTNEKFPGFIKDYVFDLKNQCIFFTTISIFFVMLEDIREYNVSQTWFISTGGIWRIITIASSVLGFGVLMVLWSHIYHSTNSMDGGEKLNKWNRLLMIFFYASCAAAILVCMIMIIVLTIKFPERKYEMYAYLHIVVIGYMVVLQLGFFVYGIRMFYILKKSSDTIKFYKVKFTKFMMVILALFFQCSVWLAIVAVEYSNYAGRMGLFIHLWKAQLLDISLLIMYPVLIYMLFEPKKFWDFGPYLKIKLAITKPYKKPVGVHEATSTDDLQTDYTTMTDYEAE